MLPNWVLWRQETVDGRATKVPYSANGGLHRGSSTDPKSWTGFFPAKRLDEEHSMAGIGFCFEGSGIAGVDFDGCSDPKSGVIDEWAFDWLKKLNSYSEVSPSCCGIKTFVRGRLLGAGAKLLIPDKSTHRGKQPAVSGHKTASVFRRYAITDEADLAEVAAALDRKREEDLSQLRHNLPPKEQQPESDATQDDKLQ